MDRIFNKQSGSQPRSGGSPAARFASLTAGLMARKGEAVPAPAHLDGVSIHSHGVARAPQSAPESQLASQSDPLSSGGSEASPPQVPPQSGPSEAPRAPEPMPQPAPWQAPPAAGAPVSPDEQLGGLTPYGASRPVPEAPHFEARETPQPSPPAPPQGDEPRPVSEEVLRQRAARRATVSTGDCCALPMPPAVTEKLPPGPYAKVTTRLDKERVRKLKILAARMETSNQKVLLAALDHYIDYACDVLASECPCLARSMMEDS